MNTFTYLNTSIGTFPETKIKPFKWYYSVVKLKGAAHTCRGFVFLQVWIVIPIIMSICGVVLVILPLTDPADSLYELLALGIVLLGVPVYFVAIQGYGKPHILTKING